MTGDTVPDMPLLDVPSVGAVAKAGPAERSDSPTASYRRNRTRLVAIAGLALLLAGAFALDAMIRRTTRALVGEHLEGALAAADAAVTLALDLEAENAATAAADPALPPLLARALADPAAAEPRAELRRRLDAALRKGHFGAVLLDERGIPLATSSSFAEKAGARLNGEGLALLGKVRELRRPLVSMPHAAGLLVEGAEPRLDRPVFAAFAPVFDGAGAFLAALAIVADPSEHLTPLLAAQRAGVTGEAYAFDARGTLLSASRFDDELRREGLLADGATATSALRVRVAQPASIAADRPLTRMAASAVAGNSGVDLDGYPNYLGRDVVGAWRWHADREFGLAVEVAEAEAYRPLRQLRMGMLALLGLVATLAAFLLRSTHSAAGIASELARVRRFGSYRLLKKLGEGGMGQVWLARHAMLSRPVALKLIRKDRLGSNAASALEAFEREAELCSRLTHPNVVTIHDCGIATSGEPYYVMEYLDGVDLKRLVKTGGPLAPERVAHVVREVCAALVEAHELGLVHRDIKASNVMLCRRGGIDDCVELLDFGLVIERESAPGEGTREGFASGTPPYMPPERWRDPTIRDPRSDLYSVGVLAWFLLTGKLPFGDDETVIDRILAEVPPRPSKLAPHPVPEALESLVMDLLKKDPAGRPASAREVIARLDRAKA